MEETFVIPEVLPDSVQHAQITEETLNFIFGEQDIIMTLKAADVEKALQDLSSEHINLKVQRRVSITLELIIEEQDQKEKASRENYRQEENCI